MTKNPDETLGSKLTEGIRDVTPEDALSQETFDFAAFVAGAKPTRRAVTLYARGDLKAQLDRIAEDLDLAEKSGDNKRTAALRAEGKRVVDEMSAPGAVIDVVVEGRSQEWLTRIEEALDKDGVTDETEKVLRRVAEQVIEPEGVTYDLLEQFRHVSEPQVRKVVVAATLANSQPLDVSADFLRERSGRSVGRASGRR